MTSWFELQENMTAVCLGHLRRQTQRQRVTSHLCHHRHKVCGGGLVVQSLTGFHSQDTAVPIDGKLGKSWALIVYEATRLAIFGVTVHTQTRVIKLISNMLLISNNSGPALLQPWHFSTHFYQGSVCLSVYTWTTTVLSAVGLDQT